MIEFSLDRRSGLAPYLQIVQQVRHALSLGLLGRGDQLPTVKEAVASLAVNPNTVLKAYRELETLKDRDRFSAWLYRIAHNTCYSKLRKDMGKTFVELLPETRSARNPIETRLAVEKALQHLPEDQREVVVLKVYQNLKFEEIALIQEAPVSTVKSRLYMGFEKLRSILG